MLPTPTLKAFLRRRLMHFSMKSAIKPFFESLTGFLGNGEMRYVNQLQLFRTQPICEFPVTPTLNLSQN
jgi:hypothetical protein